MISKSMKSEIQSALNLKALSPLANKNMGNLIMGKTKKKDNGNINVKINKPFSDKKKLFLSRS